MLNQTSITDSDTLIYHYIVGDQNINNIWEDRMCIKNNYGYITFGNNEIRKIIDATKTIENDNVTVTLKFDSKITVPSTRFFTPWDLPIFGGGPGMCPLNLYSNDCDSLRYIKNDFNDGQRYTQIFTNYI